MRQRPNHRFVTVCLCMIAGLTVFGRERSRVYSRFFDTGPNREASEPEAPRQAMEEGVAAMSVDFRPETEYTDSPYETPAFDGPVDDDPYCMPGEFEPQQAILLASGQLAAYYPGILAEIARALRGRVLLVTLVNSQDEAGLVNQALGGQYLADDDIRTVPIGNDSQWVRDYGPLFVRDWKGRISIVDPTYDIIDRPKDDELPAALGRAIGIPVVRLPIVLDGGNLLSNGDGLFLATTSLLTENQSKSFDEMSLRQSLGTYLGCENLVLLDPLVSEPTGHVDMFVTFTDAHTVVVAACDPETDPVNASILDQNAALLAQVPPPHGPLRVVRIPLPTHADGVWRTYNNVIFANGALLMPTYSGTDPAQERKAKKCYRDLLPTWEVVEIDASGIIRLDGALHCISMNVPADRIR